VKEKFVKGALDSRRIRESLNRTVKGIPTERPETTSCGLNPPSKGFPPKVLRQQQVVAQIAPPKGFPQKRLEAIASCGLHPILIEKIYIHFSFLSSICEKM
jgi:hypothetical protein